MSSAYEVRFLSSSLVPAPRCWRREARHYRFEVWSNGSRTQSIDGTFSELRTQWFPILGTFPSKHTLKFWHNYTYNDADIASRAEELRISFQNYFCRDVARERLRCSDNTTQNRCSDNTTQNWICVDVNTLSGDVRKFEQLSRCNLLEDLYKRVGMEFGVRRDGFNLLLGTRLLTTKDTTCTLSSLGITEGTLVTFIRQRFIEVLEGTRLQITEAGTADVNGVYLCVKTSRKVQLRGDLIFRQENGRHTVAWWKGNSLWPAGWYIETESFHALYFHRTEEASVLPWNMWEVYTGHYCLPGKIPNPFFTEFTEREAPEEQDTTQNGAFAEEISQSVGLQPFRHKARFPETASPLELGSITGRTMLAETREASDEQDTTQNGAFAEELSHSVRLHPTRHRARFQERTPIELGSTTGRTTLAETMPSVDSCATPGGTKLKCLTYVCPAHQRSGGNALNFIWAFWVLSFLWVIWMSLLCLQ